MTKPKEYVIITARTDAAIHRIVDRLFERGRGQVRMRELEQELVRAVGYNPTERFAEDNPNFRRYKEAGYRAHEIKNQIVYERFAP